MSISRLSVPSRKTCFPVNWRLLVKEYITNIGIPLDILSFCRFDDFWRLKLFLVFGSLQTSLLCIIMGELAGGGFVAVAVGVSDR